MQLDAQFLQPHELDRLRRRESAAIDAEVQAHGPALERAARRLAREADVDELVQDVWTTFLEILPRFEGRSRTRTFLFGILRTKAAEQRRPSRADATDPISLDAMPAAALDGEQLATGRELGAAIDACIDALPAKERRAVELKLVGDGETGQVGRALGVSTNHLAVLLHRARAHLRHCLGAHLT